jgi:ribosomal protein S18
MKPSTKAKSLIERTDALTPLNFDLFTSTQKGAKFVLLDYNMTSPIRTARRTLIQAEKNLQKVADKKARDEAKKKGVTDENKLNEITGIIPKQQRDINNAINNAYEEALQNILTNSISQDALGNEVIDFIQKQGYRTALAGTVRFKGELLSNIANALIINPKALGTGIMNAKLIASANGYEFMKNAKSKQTSRLYSSDALSGKLVDPQILKQTSGIKGSVSKGALLNRTTQIYNLTLKKLVQNPVEYIADTMLTTPDKVVSMPLWFGSFMNEFKRITGEEVNQEMMINNDLDYMQKNADAIEQATRKADQESVYSGAANNEFMGVLKGKLKPDQSFTQKAWNNFNSFMTNFMNFDYAAARSAVYNLFNEGYMTKQKAAAVLAGITTRSVIYQVMVANMGAGVVGAALGLAFDWEDEEEVDEKSFFQMLGRGLANVFIGYTVGRNFGNGVRGMINFGVEKINEEYLDFLRNGEYDFYKDNIAYTYVNVGDRGDIDVAKMGISMAGPYTPALNTTVLIGKNFGALSSRVMGEGTTKKEPEAIRREDMTINYRIPLELAGNAGLIPFYKDVKRAVNDEIYKDLRKAANTPDSSITTPDDYDKLKDLKELKNKTKNQEERRAIDKKIVEIVGSEEAKASIDKQKEALTAKKKSLLYDRSGGRRYNNESDMKRLNPALWRKRFGPNSDWDKKTKAKEAVESKLQKESTAREDKEFKKNKRGN